MIKYFLLFVLFNLFSYNNSQDSNGLFEDYTKHQCKRNCEATKPMTCVYNFTVEWYISMSKACYDCPFNLTDCNRIDCISADGVTRILMAVNRMMPGPTIDICQNDTLVVYVSNNLKMGESISIHWHGQLQKGTPYMDGITRITQCSIEAHTTFQYKFKAEQYGTHFWHAHTGLQRADGVFGALIVREIKNRTTIPHYEYDFDLPEHIIVLNDWFNESVLVKFVTFTHDRHVGPSRPSSILINGKGIKKQFSLNGTNQVFETPRAVFRVRRGFRYRFRVIDAGSIFCPFQLSIQRHPLTVIASDGQNMNAFQVSALNLNPGERYDFLIDANQPNERYLIIAKGLGDCALDQLFQTAILEYENASNTALTNSNFNYNDLIINGIQLNTAEIEDNKMVRISEMRGLVTDKEDEILYTRIVQKPDKQFYFGMEFKTDNNPEFNNHILYPNKFLPAMKRVNTPQFNGISMILPSSPILYHYDKIPKNLVCNADNRTAACPDNSTICSCYHIIEVGLNDLVEIVFVDVTDNLPTPLDIVHPIHLHGHKFSILAIGDFENTTVTNDLIKSMDENGQIHRNFDRPMMKDTVLVPNNGYAIIRFVADNPGFWLMHCHIEMHAEIGMTAVIKVGNTTDIPEKPKNWQTCGNFFFEN